MRILKHILIIIIFTGVLNSCIKDEDDRPDRNPVINSISPVSGIKGTEVRIFGTGFGNIPADVKVFLNGNIMATTVVSENEIRFLVPAKSESGLVSVSVEGNAASGPWFTYVYTYTVSTFSGQPGVAGFADGNNSVALYNSPRGLTIDEFGNLYVADVLNNRIRRISPGGDAIAFAGSGIAGHLDGNSTGAQFNNPYDIDLDAINGYLYVADKLNHCVRRISLAGDVTTAAGIPGIAGYVDAPGLSARLNGPTGIALEGENVNVYVTDSENHCIRKLDVFQVLSTFSGTNIDGLQDGTGTAARFSSPSEITYDTTGFLFVTDMVNHNIRRINKNTTEVITVSGAGSPGFLDGPAALAEFDIPVGIASQNNEVFVCDQQNNRIRKISRSKIVSTVAGDGVAGFADGPGANAQFNNPSGIVRTKEGDYFITDTGNHCIRKLVVD